MRIVTALVLSAAVAALAGCSSEWVGETSPAAQTTDAVPSEGDLVNEGAPPEADDSGLIAAQYPACDLGSEILDYLATGDNGGDPSMDRVFAKYVGVPEPQARALADEWIAACDKQQAEQEAAASSSAAASSAEAAADASEAAQYAEDRRACEAIGGRYVEPKIWGGACESTVEGGDPGNGEPFMDCGGAWIGFPATEADLAQMAADYPGCF